MFAIKKVVLFRTTISRGTTWINLLTDSLISGSHHFPNR